MKCSIGVKVCAALFAMLALAATAAAQDAARVAPAMYKVRLNNARVRVLEVNAKAGQKAPKHVHPDYVVYITGGGKVRFTDAKGASTETDMNTGEVMWRGAETHASEAVTDFGGLLFELKGPKRAGRPKAAGALDPVTADPAHFKALLDNERVRVLDYRSGPGEKVAMHWHPNYITYDLTGGNTRFTYPKGKPVERVAKAGDLTWHMSETHGGENIGAAEIHVILVELK
jgi:quercetin dioxygenase-like cupin family protein